MTRILHLIDSLGVGGAERQLAISIGALDQQHFQSFVGYLHQPSQLEDLFTERGIPLYELGVRGRHQWPKGILKLRQLVKSLGIDLIHTQLFQADVIGGLTGWISGVPVISTLTNTGYEPEWLTRDPYLNRLKKTMPRLVRSLIARYCDRHLIAVSMAVKSSAIRQFGLPEAKISVVYRGLSPDWTKGNCSHVPAPEENALEVEDRWPVLSNVGRLVPQKGQRYLIMAMPEIVQKCPKVFLLIAGDGILRSELEELSEQLGVQDHIRFLGQRNDVRRILETSDIFVFPSLSEGCPNALIEAFSIGKPSVASRIAPVEEIAQDGKEAMLVESRSPEAIAGAVVHLASCPTKARAMGDRAKKKTLSQFTLDQVSRDLERVYDQVLLGTV